MIESPVLLVTFNRPDTTRIVFDSIRKAKPSKLYVFNDGPRLGNEADVKAREEIKIIINQVDWDCDLLLNFSEKNMGCGPGVSSAITWAFQNEDRIIILEDDCLPDITFFRFCEELLEKYRFDSRIGTIAGPNTQFGNCRNEYSYYFSQFWHSWGWATWRRVWKDYDLKMKLWPLIRDGKYLDDIIENEAGIKCWNHILELEYNKPDTWDYQFTFHLLINNYLNIMPVTNLISNIGHGPEAVHTKEPGIHANMKFEPLVFPLSHPPFIVRDKKADSYRYMESYISFKPKKNILIRIKNKVLRTLKQLLKQKVKSKLIK